VVAAAEDGVRAVLARDGRASGAGRPPIAREHRVAEVRAAGALQEVARDRGHVANLHRGARAQGLRDDGVAVPDQRVIREVLHPLERADADAAAAGRHAAQRQRGDVDEPRGRSLAVLDQRDEVGPARDVFRARRRAERQRGGQVRRARIAEGGHRVASLRMPVG
jgi:hypothetical protein